MALEMNAICTEASPIDIDDLPFVNHIHCLLNSLDFWRIYNG